jgi:hypothetical protein
MNLGLIESDRWGHSVLKPRCVDALKVNAGKVAKYNWSSDSAFTLSDALNAID